MTDSSSVLKGPPGPPTTTMARPVDPEASVSGTANHGVALVLRRPPTAGPPPSALSPPGQRTGRSDDGHQITGHRHQGRLGRPQTGRGRHLDQPRPVGAGRLTGATTAPSAPRIRRAWSATTRRTSLSANGAFTARAASISRRNCPALRVAARSAARLSRHNSTRSTAMATRSARPRAVSRSDSR